MEGVALERRRSGHSLLKLAESVRASRSFINLLDVLLLQRLMERGRVECLRVGVDFEAEAVSVKGEV